MNKLIVVSVHPIHYNDYLFSEIDKSGIDVEVYYTNKSLSEYPWKNRLNYDFKQDNCKYFLGIDWRLIKAATFSNNVFLVYGWNTFFKNILLLLLILFRRKYVVFTDTFQSDRKRSWVKKTLRDGWLKLIFSNAYQILTTGAVGIRKLGELYSSTKVINFPFTTDTNFFSSTPDFSDFKGMKVLFSSGRLLNSHKAYDVALKGLSIVKDAGYKFQYLIAGVGPDEENIKTMAKDMNLSDDVVFLGWQELDTLKERYAACHLFLHSSHFDPFPNCILEAMASGAIVVSSNGAGSAVERINNGVNGYIFDDNDEKQMAKMVIDVFAMDEKQLSQISREARKTSEKWNVQYNVDLIKKIVLN